MTALASTSETGCIMVDPEMAMCPILSLEHKKAGAETTRYSFKADVAGNEQYCLH